MARLSTFYKHLINEILFLNPIQFNYTLVYDQRGALEGGTN